MLNADSRQIALETELLEVLELKRMTATDFGEVLKRVEYFGGIELMYHTDLSRVQRNLNELPH